MSKRKQEEESDNERVLKIVIQPPPRSLLTFFPQELVDVEFEFFDPIADIDWHGIKRLLTQLLQADAPLFHPNPLADLILSQPLIGSTVKCDGRESDPYAFLSVINLNTHAVRFLPERKTGHIDCLSSGSPFNQTLYRLCSF